MDAGADSAAVGYSNVSVYRLSDHIRDQVAEIGLLGANEGPLSIPAYVTLAHNLIQACLQLRIPVVDDGLHFPVLFEIGRDRNQEAFIRDYLPIFHLEVEETKIVGILMGLDNDHAVDFLSCIKLGVAVPAHDNVELRNCLGQFDILAVAEMA